MFELRLVAAGIVVAIAIVVLTVAVNVVAGARLVQLDAMAKPSLIGCGIAPHVEQVP